MRDNSETGMNLKAVGKKVTLKKLERYHEREVGGIYIPESTDANNRMTKAEVISVGRYAYQENIEEGMTVLYDTASVFQDKHPYVITNVENVIVQIKDDDTLQPLGNNLLLERINTEEKIGSIFLPDDVQKEGDYRRQYKYKVLGLGLGKVIGGKTWSFDVKVGQYIIASEDVEFAFTRIDYKGKVYYLLDASNVVAIINE